MPATLGLDNGEHITYESAIKKDENIINGATYPRARRQLFQKLWDQRATIQDIVRHYLRLRDEDACIVEEGQWIRGSFNVCIPVEVRVGRLQSETDLSLSYAIQACRSQVPWNH